MQNWIVAAAWALFSTAALAAPTGEATALEAHGRSITEYRTIRVQGLNIFYRVAGREGAPVVILLHGFPSSSRMYESLIPALATRYRVIAPDYPGFGHSDAPAPDSFPYTFDHLAAVMDGFMQQLGLGHFALYVQAPT